MITSVIGRIFLDAYNKRENTGYDAKTFFIEKYYPLFFDAEKYMQWVQNSPFVQMKNGQKVETLSSKERHDKLDELIDKIQNGVRDASVAIGYSASDEKGYATTSGQVTNLNIEVSKDEVYLSWIGSSLGVGVQGGFCILFSNPQILLNIYDGWSLYRKALNNNHKLRGNQITSWNGQWIAHRYDRYSYDSEYPMADFDPFVTSADASMSVSVQSWTKILIHIALSLPEQNLMGYVYSYGQTNTTIGFIPFMLSQIRRPIDLYISFFGMRGRKEAESLYGTAFGFDKACQAGVIGIKALEPKGLRDYMEKGKLPKYNDNEEQTIKYHIYQIWIMAMLDNQDLWRCAEEFALLLQAYSRSSNNAKTDKSNKVKALLNSSNKKDFINNLTVIIPDIDEQDKVIETARKVNDMPADNVPYFLTLIRFHYTANTIK